MLKHYKFSIEIQPYFDDQDSPLGYLLFVKVRYKGRKEVGRLTALLNADWESQGAFCEAYSSSAHKSWEAFDVSNPQVDLDFGPTVFIDNVFIHPEHRGDLKLSYHLVKTLLDYLEHSLSYLLFGLPDTTEKTQLSRIQDHWLDCGFQPTKAHIEGHPEMVIYALNTLYNYPKDSWLYDHCAGEELDMLVQDSMFEHMLRTVEVKYPE